MKRLFAPIALLGLLGSGITVIAQHTQPSPSTSSAQTHSQDQASAQEPQKSPEMHNQEQTARSFEGKIKKSGDKLVLQELATETNYELDDQRKAKKYEGQTVKVMATMEPNTNTLHVVDISPVSK
jgi:uncharacterized FlaG/YvyC family protein